MCLSVDGRSLVIVGVTRKRRRENELKTIDLIGRVPKRLTERQTGKQTEKRPDRRAPAGVEGVILMGSEKNIYMTISPKVLSNPAAKVSNQLQGNKSF